MKRQCMSVSPMRSASNSGRSTSAVKTICRHRKKVLQNKLRLTSLLPAEYLCTPKGAKLNSPKCHTHSIQNCERARERACAGYPFKYIQIYAPHTRANSQHTHTDTLARNTCRQLEIESILKIV
jgi:hypothetical protein